MGWNTGKIHGIIQRKLQGQTKRLKITFTSLVLNPPTIAIRTAHHLGSGKLPSLAAHECSSRKSTAQLRCSFEITYLGMTLVYPPPRMQSSQMKVYCSGFPSPQKKKGSCHPGGFPIGILAQGVVNYPKV